MEDTASVLIGFIIGSFIGPIIAYAILDRMDRKRR